MENHDSDGMVEKTRKDYNLIAREWDLSRMRPSQIKLNLIYDVEEGETVLDIGCGNGLMVPFLLEKGTYYTGIDIADKLTDIARARYKEAVENGRVRFMTALATELPVPDAQFDVAISFAVLHHLPSVSLRKQFFDEIRRTLRPHGRAKITVWNLLNGWAKEKFDIAMQLGDKTAGDVYIPWKGTGGILVNRYVHQFAEEELRGLAEDAGFSDISIGYFNRAGERTGNGEEMVLEMNG